MVKNKSKKKSKGKRPKGTTPDSVDVAGDTQPLWSTSDECAHYAALGCHIANIVRCRQEDASKSKSRHKPKYTTNTCSEYEEMYQLAMQQYPWLLGMERFDPTEYHPEDIENIPEVAMNDGEEEDEQMTLTLTNVTKNTTNICFVTVYDVDLCDSNGDILKSGMSSNVTTSTVNAADDPSSTNGGADSTTTTSTAKERKCTTFIVLCPPQTFVHLCSLAPTNQSQPSSTTEKIIPITSWSQIEIESDVQPWSFHSNIDDEHPYLLHFPFDGVGKETSERDMAYQCTQSEHGQLTHFFHGNYHAIDFACPIGTPLYSPANGVVVDVRDNHVDHGDDEKCNGGISSGNLTKVIEVSGIGARNLFHWNSIMVRVDEKCTDTTTISIDEPTDPLFIEFVHIQTNSCAVQVGDVVQKGHLLCRSGSVGFSPEPHLHLAAYRSNGNDAATVRVRFELERIPSRGCDGDGENSSDRDAGDRASSADGGERGEKVLSFLPMGGGWYNRRGLL
mmetsp:Transcript_34368/g.61691  ORF Transcript_34368/g.61691 Transcript_34368/m.61691 type:complete len:504 (-) Transcript_34368:35-1546(-)